LAAIATVDPGEFRLVFGRGTALNHDGGGRLQRGQ